MKEQSVGRCEGCSQMTRVFDKQGVLLCCRCYGQIAYQEIVQKIRSGG